MHPNSRRWRFNACPEIGMANSPVMIQTIEAIVDVHGAVRLLEPVQLDRRHRALVTILADEPSEAHETALLKTNDLSLYPPRHPLFPMNSASGPRGRHSSAQAIGLGRVFVPTNHAA